ncbi:MAG: MFS transporter, partial [Nocardioidaceae bacterium]
MSDTTVPARIASPAGRWLLLATVLGSSMAMLDATVVTVALPRLGHSLDAGVTGLQWTLNAYTLALASLILLGGSLGDRWGRRRVFVVGVVWFAVASALCGAAPDISTLVAARALQGIGAALLTPGSLALISASIDERDRGAAIGAWSGLGGVAAAVGPLLGGWLVDAVSWRAVFLINIPAAAVIVWVSVRHVPESHDPDAVRSVDVTGALLTAAGLASLTYGLISSGTVAVVLGLVLLLLFVLAERRSDHPLVPLSLFGDRVFTAAN